MKLEGTWYNELKSKMVLKVDGAAVTGSYETAVGETFGPCALSGRAETASKGSQSVAFVVCWQNDKATAHCCTAWSGQLQVDKAGKESLVTTWLLTEDTSPGDDWNSTKVGQDIFYRDPPTTAPKLAERRRAPSHPRKST